MSHSSRPEPRIVARPAPAHARGAAHVLVAALVAACVAAAFAGMLGHAFVGWDDPTYVLENPLVLGHRWGAMFHAVVSHQYHPLTLVTLAWNAGTPLSPRSFLVTNLALHVANTLLVYALVRTLSGGRTGVAAFVALVFGVHPMHVESVAWISERKDVLHVCLWLAALWAYVRRVDGGGARWLAAAFVLFVAACLAKATAVSLVPAMLLVDLWRRRPLDRDSVLEKLPFVAVALLAGVVAIEAQAGRDFHGLLRAPPASASVIPDLSAYGAYGRFALPAYGFASYLARFLAPVGLSAFDPYPTPAEAAGAAVRLAPLVLLAALGIAAWDGRRSRVLAFGIGWFCVTIALVLQWLPVGAAITADRYSYLPYAGLAFAAGMGLDAATRRSQVAGRVLWSVAAAFVAMLFVLTVRQVATWRDTETLWTRAIEVHPRASLPYVFRSTGRIKGRRIAEAAVDLETARRLGDHTTMLYDNLGCVQGYGGRLDSALVSFERALEIDPANASALTNRAVVLLRRDRASDALADLDRALALAPGMAATVRPLRGFAHAKLGQAREALPDLDFAITAGTRDPTLFVVRGNCRNYLGDRAGAADDYRAALRLDPGNAGARAQLEGLGAAAR